MPDAAASSAMQRSGELVDALQHSLAESGGAPVERIETHSAWILLTGDLAYKIKKPVNFGFLDYSSLDKRRFFCAEEIRLNQRFAAEIYLDVVAIGGVPARVLTGSGEPVLEYAVRMRRFPAGGLLSQLAAAGQLHLQHIDQMAERIAGFHQAAARAAADSPFGRPDQVHHWVRENFTQLRAALPEGAESGSLERLQTWVECERERIDSLLQQRKRGGFIRECHGDLHLGNLTVIDSRVTPFDCIEFNPELRWIDVFSELAFLVMDLEDRGLRNYAFRFLNAYLQSSGDYTGLGVLRYYLVYRSLVRAKVAVLRRQQTTADSVAFQLADREYREYVDLALRSTGTGRLRLLITFGLSGSGKSTLAGAFAERLAMIRVRSDSERKRLAGLGAGEHSDSGVGAGLYSTQRSEDTYARLESVCEQVLDAGYPAIVDAAFLQRDSRNRFRKLASARGIPFVILACQAPIAELEARIAKRLAAGTDPSEATLEVLRAQLRLQQLPQEEDADQLIEIDTGAPEYLEQAITRLEQPG